jgi:hypothetical protein
MGKKTVTATAWLYLQIKKYIDDSNVPNTLLEQANKMHEKQMEDAWYDGGANWDSEKIFNEYYKETYE